MHPPSLYGRSIAGFTLAELLIALVILGVIATFTIPKVLSSQQDTKYKALGKEVAGMISAAYEAYKHENTPTAAMVPYDLAPYMNYVRVDSLSVVDDSQTNGNRPCSTTWCLVLHNGAFLQATGGTSFNSTAATNAIMFRMDPDGKVTDGGTGDTSPTAPGKAVHFWLYYDGRLTTRGGIVSNTCNSSGCFGPAPSQDPPWFNWN